MSVEDHLKSTVNFYSCRSSPIHLYLLYLTEGEHKEAFLPPKLKLSREHGPLWLVGHAALFSKEAGAQIQWGTMKTKTTTFSFPRESFFVPLLHPFSWLKPFPMQEFSSQCWVQRFLLHWTPFPSPLLWTFKCVCFLNSLLFLNLIIKGRRRGEESEKRVKWRRKSILHLPHLSKHLPSPSPPRLSVPGTVP